MAQLAQMSVRWRDEAALTVVMAARAIPAAPQKGSAIRGVDEAAGRPAPRSSTPAPARRRDGELVANGGRVLNVTATGATVAQAQRAAYAAVDRIDWPDGFFRRDIGWRAVERENEHPRAL